MAQRLVTQQAWCADVAQIAQRAGADAPPLFDDGYWGEAFGYDPDMSDEEGMHPDPYNPDDRALQLKRLSGYGQAPDGRTEGGEAFDATLPWPQCFWWRDRDRIVLLHEFLEVWPPMGHQGWEESIRDRVCLLWGKKFLWDNAHMSNFRDDEMCGYRYLAALRSCPRYLRPGMSASLLEKVRQHVCQSQ